MKRAPSHWVPFLILSLTTVLTAPVSANETAAGEIELRKGLAIERVGRAGRMALHTDAIETEIVAGTWKAPKGGEEVTSADGSVKTWKTMEANEDGWFQGRSLRGGYVYFPVQAERKKIMLLEPAGHSVVYVNGVPRTGDVYSYGNARLPVQLERGENDILFRVARGRLRAKLVDPEAEILLSSRDLTLPDLITGEDTQTWGAAIAINATVKPVDALSIRTVLEGGQTTTTPIPPLLPLSMRKVGFRLEGDAPGETGIRKVTLQLIRGKRGQAEPLHEIEFEIGVRGPEQTQKRTFISEIDGSVQYYAVNPANPVPGAPKPAALFLSTHGASVEGINQANAYSAKTWGHLVAPTNRRPYGFDWEEWGRLDALEVLDIEMERLGTDPLQTYLTGHSMGGHGAWTLGVTFPDRFAAVGPSAGWISFFSYGGSERYEDDGVRQMLRRATASSDTLAMSKNYLHHGIYILHGGADDNVPPTEARKMNEHLAEFHHDFFYHEEPDVGHWWDNDDEPGAACVDWQPMFDFFARHKRPTNETLRNVNFTTVNPGVSAWCYWACVETQIKQLEPSSIDIRFDTWRRRFSGTTENVSRLALDVAHVIADGTLAVQLDGQMLDNLAYPARSKKLYFQRTGDTWTAADTLSPNSKGPHRYGPFKEALNHRFMFVYGTTGTKEENAWSFNKARFDAEQFWYRGNGSVDVIADTNFDPHKEADRGVVIYGNADTNAAWEILLKNSPVQVKRGSIRIGERTLEDDDLSALFIQPRPDSDIACVAVIGGSGVKGMRLNDRLAYFLAGTGYPDCLVLGPDVLTDAADGVRAAGFFGLDWSVENGDFAWRE